MNTELKTLAAELVNEVLKRFVPSVESIVALPDAAKAAIPIIAVTANAYQEDANEAIAAGMDGYASKPIDPAVIRAINAQKAAIED